MLAVAVPPVAVSVIFPVLISVVVRVVIVPTVVGMDAAKKFIACPAPEVIIISPAPVSNMPPSMTSREAVMVRACPLAVPFVVEMMLISAPVIVVASSAAKFICPVAKNVKSCCVVMLASLVDCAFIVPLRDKLCAFIIVSPLKIISPQQIKLKNEEEVGKRGYQHQRYLDDLFLQPQG